MDKKRDREESGSMSARANKITGRFPAHLEADGPGKQLDAVATAIATPLDTLAGELSEIRRSHRVGHAQTRIDLGRIGGIHGLSSVELGGLYLRADHVKQMTSDLQTAANGGDDVERDRLVGLLLEMFQVSLPEPVLETLNPSEADPNKTAMALAQNILDGIGRRALIDALRARVVSVSRNHATGNGAIGSLIEGAANALDMDVDVKRNAEVKTELQERNVTTLNYTISDGLFHNVDRFLHATFARDRFALQLPKFEDQPEPLPMTRVDEIIGLEENPRRRAKRDIHPVKHAQCFAVARRGFVPQLLQIEISAHVPKSGDPRPVVGPMLVNRDQGLGVGFVGTIQPEETLTISETGRMYLSGSDTVDVTGLGYSWTGACFTSKYHAKNDNDFVFEGLGRDPETRVATFVMATPAGALDRDSLFPSGALAVDVPRVGLGMTRYAFFTQWGHITSSEEPSPPAPDRRVTPRTKIDFTCNETNRGSVFGTSVATENPPAANLTLSWLEQEAYVVRLHLPARFKTLDDDDGATMSGHVLAAIERFRPAGIKVEIVYQDEQWILGEGTIPGTETPDPTSVMLGGTVLGSSPPTEE
ncbi:MAG: hypothetical protein GY847_09055 [Proteobacteria bacterium]|nr:hypothetical protein [Pseudomonadota bacterium]